MSQIFAFGENVQGYNTPVLNEREIRASAGLFFLAVLIALMLILFKQNFLPIKYLITVFLTDFLIRVFVNPRFAPSLIIGRMIVGNQTPEYVGAPPKKVAWIIGVVLAAIMFSMMVIGFTASDISVTNGSVSNFSGSGATYSFTVTPGGSGVALLMPASASAFAFTHEACPSTRVRYTGLP